MKAQLPIFYNKEHLTLPQTSTARLTNSVNRTAYNSFNKWGGLTFEDILSNYPKETIDKCWKIFAQSIIENYQKGKGTFIKNFGTFTFTNVEYNLEGTTNEYSRDIKRRRPVFIVSNEYIDYIKPGIYTEKSGVIYYTQKINKNVNIVKLNFAKLSFGGNISKEEISTIIYAIIKNMSDKIRRNAFKEKVLPGVGTFLNKGNIFGMKFDQNLFNETSLQTQKLFHIKKNFKFYMETKDSMDVPHRNIKDIDKAEREMRPNIAVLTKITSSADDWLKENMGINIKNDIIDEPREDLSFLNDKKNLTFVKKNNDFLVDQRYYRSYPLQDLYGLKIPQNILESIYKNKSLLIRAMKQIDRHGDGLIPKYDFINAFYKTNCHYSLKIELIEDIVNVYLNNPNIIMVKYTNLINSLCNDIKYIIDHEYNLFPINKYRYSISQDNKRAVSQNMFSRDTGNLNPKAISSVHKYNKLPRISESEIRKEIENIGKISIFLLNNYKANRMISYLELMEILEKYRIYLNKELIVYLLRFLDIKNPNCFSINDFISKINKSLMNSTCFNFRKNNTLNNSINSNNLNEQSLNGNPTLTDCNSSQNYNRHFNFPNNNKQLIKSNTNLKSNIIALDKKNIFENKENYNNYENEPQNNIIKNIDSNLLNIKLIKIIKDKIFHKSSKIDNISEYFDHLLSYNICRKENIIYPDELERLFQLEQYSFTIPEINSIFHFIDTKKDGFIDRIEFINSIRNVPHPISSFINYMKNNGLGISDIAYKMEFDLYSRPLSECLNTILNKLSFQVKMKLVNDKYDNVFLNGLFDSISEGKNEITVEKIFNIFNYNNDESYKHLSEIKNEIINMCHDIIPKCVSFTELKNNFSLYDRYLTGEVNLDMFLTVMKKFLGSKINSQNLLHFLRILKLINNKNIVNYRQFLMIIYIECKDDKWIKCLNAFRAFLKKECNDDLFIFIVKINNFCNNLNIKRTVEFDRMHRFLQGRIGMELDMKTVMKFDYNKDGIISMDDLKNIILVYLDKHFFETKKSINENNKLNELKIVRNENKKLFIVLKDILNKNNMTEDNLFCFLDNNKDNLVDYNEFKIQLPKLLKLSEKSKFNAEQIDKFFNYIDEYKTKKVDINTFRNKLRIFNDEINKNHENGYKGNSTIENLILTEFSKWFNRNKNLSDTELFPILDHDHDGIISINDIKYFASNILLMPLNELSEHKILHFIVAVSLTNSNNLILADIQNLMQNVKKNKTENYLTNIHNYCNEGIDETNKDKEWITDVINRIGMYLNEVYDNDIKQFYDDYNTTNFRNLGQGLSFDNFQNFLDCNYHILEQYHIYEKQQLVLFNYISGNKKFITLEMLQKLFCKNNNNNYDFYLKMHKDIIKFLHENYPKCEDAFKFFHSVKTKNQETPTYNDYLSKNTFITKKEFFEGLNKIFPNKYKTKTILNYYQKVFKKKLNQNKLNENQKQDDIYTNIKFSEFNYVYYSDFEFDTYFSKTLNKDSKILTTRPTIKGIPFTTFNSPFEVKEHEKFETPYDLDPLEKVKRLILSSKMDFKKDFKEIINETSNGMVNQFEFRNIIKKLDIGLTNIEIEDIIHKSGMGADGNINLVDFYKYIIDENKNLVISKKHVLEQLKEIKQLIYKYYSNPRLAFELNDNDVLGKIDFDKFKKIVYDLYKREKKQSPSYAVLKYVYDYIDIRKDGIIDINEWNKIFAGAEGKLDLSAAEVLPSQMKILREWETSNNIIEIYKIIAKHRKIIKDKVRLFTIEQNSMLIKANDLIYILKDVLNKIKLSQTQWKMIVSIGDKDKSGIIDFNTFISVVDTTAKMGLSHPVI